ncbi:uncharacterized protein [Fopius arisanus]|uniref:Uncharacterized protein n=2 Tax=Fopius arisanus TaxID=64838 RepID=A0A9R1TUB5_9HYME|nr:PREDICTED: uncharacterized protein LOC105274193 [Fopius arisanus]
MSRLKYRSFMLLFIVIWVNAIVSVPIPLPVNSAYNQTSQTKEVKTRPKFVEIKLPIKLASMDELFAWVKNTMHNMASKIDIKLGGDRSENGDGNKSAKNAENVEIKEQSAASRNAVVGYEDMDSWSETGNEMFAPLLNAEAFLPLFFGNNANKLRGNEYSRYAYNAIGDSEVSKNKKMIKLNSGGTIAQSILSSSEQNNSDAVELPTERPPSSMLLNGSKISLPSPVPFSIPFEAYITITREPHEFVSKIQANTTATGSNNSPNISPLVFSSPVHVPRQITSDCNHSRDLVIRDHFQSNQSGNFKERPCKEKSHDPEEKKERLEAPKRKNNSRTRDNSRKRQLSTLGDILKSLGLIRKPNKGSKLQESATTSSAIRKNKRPPDDPTRPTFLFDDRPTRNESSQRQEFDDSDEEEKGGSLGSVADLVPLALPILEGLSDPESEDDIIEVIEAAVPILQGLSEGDGDDEGGGVNDLIGMIVPLIIRIINGRDGQGIDLAALFGPIFNLLAPFIGPVLAPIIGPLIRTISNPPTDGSSLGALITAIAGPLSAPQEPSGMSPLSIVIAGTTAALLRELKPGTPGGSDVGALVGSILSGVLAGTSAGLSGGSSGASGGGGAARYGTPVTSSTINVGFPGRPAANPLHSSFSNGPSHAESTVHIGSTVRPTYLYPHHQTIVASVATPTRLPSPRPSIVHHNSGPLAAATAQDSYLPTGAAVSAASVNPLALLGNSVKDILGAGIQVVSSLINAVFGILGASSSEEPAPTYGAPSGYGHASG